MDLPTLCRESEQSGVVNDHREAFHGVGRLEEAIHFFELFDGHVAEVDAVGPSSVALEHSFTAHRIVCPDVVQDDWRSGTLADRANPETLATRIAGKIADDRRAEAQQLLRERCADASDLPCRGHVLVDASNVVDEARHPLVFTYHDRREATPEAPRERRLTGTCLACDDVKSGGHSEIVAAAPAWGSRA
jgi:hypothetical protein